MTDLNTRPVIAIDPWTVWVRDVRPDADGSFVALVHYGAAPPAATYAVTIRIQPGDERPATVVVRDHGPDGDRNHVEAWVVPDVDLPTLPAPLALTFTGWVPTPS